MCIVRKNNEKKKKKKTFAINTFYLIDGFIRSMSQQAQIGNKERLPRNGEGKSSMACYQIFKTESPNNKDNTVIFTIFEAKDHRGNLKIALARFKSQVDELQITR